jgi:hypothetical protein
MNVLLTAASLLLVAASSADTPPHAPNFCGQTFCLELQPMLHAERKGFVKIQKDLLELDGRSWLRLKYGDLGTVSVFGPFSNPAKVTTVTYDKGAEEIAVNSCIQDNGRQDCRRYLISISDNGVAKKPLVCSVISFWPTQPGKNSPDARLGERMDVAAKSAEHCL